MRLIKSHAPQSNWNDILAKGRQEAGVSQSLYWARVISLLDGASPYFIRVETDEKEILGQALILKRYVYDRKKARKLFPLPHIECIDGPVILNDTLAYKCHEAILYEILAIARQSLATHIICSPSHASRYAGEERAAKLYREFGFAVKPWATYLVDILPPQE